MYVTTHAYRTLLARAVEGEAVTLTPATLKLGVGRYDSASGVLSAPHPSDTDLAQPAVSNIALTLTRYGPTLRITALVPGSTYPGTYTEAGLFLADGTAVILDAFRPVIIEPGMTKRFTYTLFPDVP